MACSSSSAVVCAVIDPVCRVQPATGFIVSTDLSLSDDDDDDSSSHCFSLVTRVSLFLPRSARWLLWCLLHVVPFTTGSEILTYLLAADRERENCIDKRAHMSRTHASHFTPSPLSLSRIRTILVCPDEFRRFISLKKRNSVF